MTNSRTIQAFVTERKALLRTEIAKLPRPPHLVIIQVNDDFASNKYIQGKLNDAAEVKMKATLTKLPVNISEEDLIKVIEENNNNKAVDGIIVQMPLPRQISEEKIKQAINPEKDVDGFHPLSSFNACTPYGVINYLKAVNVKIEGENVLIIGRSNIVGKPAAQLFLNENANVTVVHSRTKEEDLNNFLSNAKIVVVAVGKPHFIHQQKLREDAVLVDVGINRLENGQLVGDIYPDQKVELQTPVPGGVGLLTRLTLLENVMEAFKNGI
ncbi:MAG TPA: tetrahydrofolate dehydrogenase/cyclohydrolase catalytic domain-containing protein [Bacilli bacterium]|nr:tetrahydrofolate dehydrogenase/cyclohydrolase catalytic domain-containing protein [Bacilli bacterium]